MKMHTIALIMQIKLTIIVQVVQLDVLNQFVATLVLLPEINGDPHAIKIVPTKTISKN